MGNGWVWGWLGVRWSIWLMLSWDHSFGCCFEHKLKGRTVAGRPVWMVAWTGVRVGGKWSDSGHILKKSREDILGDWMWDVREMTARFLTWAVWMIHPTFTKMRNMFLFSLEKKKILRLCYYEISVRRLPRFNPWNLSSTLSYNFNFEVTLNTIFFFVL